MKRTSLDQEAGDERRRPWSALLRQLGATRPGVWVIKHVVSPLDRWLYQRTGGWRVALGRPLGPLLLLTTTGRRTGKEHTTPVYYVRNGTRLVLRNVNPGFEHPNPWILNLRANPLAIVQIGSEKSIYQAREASQAEVDRDFPQLVQVWPAYQAFYERSRQRVIFVPSPSPPRRQPQCESGLLVRFFQKDRSRDAQDLSCAEKKGGKSDPRVRFLVKECATTLSGYFTGMELFCLPQASEEGSHKHLCLAQAISSAITLRVREEDENWAFPA